MNHPAHIALIDETGSVALADLQKWAAAFNQDIAENFHPVWNAGAIAAVYTDATKPANAWAIRIKANLGQPGALGYHTDQLNQPVADVELTTDTDTPVTISHEGKEMLADSSGNRMRPAPMPAGLDASQVGLAAGAWVRYLLEVCDPPEAVSYQVLGVPQSDFILPPWYQTVKGGRYSFAGGCTLAQQVADGGYCSFARPDDHWFQVFNQDGALQVNDLGVYNGSFEDRETKTLREWADCHARAFRAAPAQ